MVRAACSDKEIGGFGACRRGEGESNRGGAGPVLLLVHPVKQDL